MTRSKRCIAHRQGDELYCPKCGLRWGIDEDPPCPAAQEDACEATVAVKDRKPADR